ncbi:hypothetical protein [Acidimangrovimonas pyrenivorans]|uniref:Uncharacterized protein n=1 Tax=Acidimangrovimonas pyrenivorans TaxID=2030798 RepID=A0ABV7AC23_9RHOB
MMILARLREKWRRDAAYRKAKDILRYPLHYTPEQVAWAQQIVAEDARKNREKTENGQSKAAGARKPRTGH